MEKYTSDLLASMHIQLQKVALNAENNLQLAEHSFHVVESCIEQLKEYILSNGFKSIEQEISFFKEIKPLFQKELVYFFEVFAIESDKPQVSIEKQKSYYNQCLNSIDLYFDRNQKFYNYCRANKAYLDEIFFLRQSPGTEEWPINKHDFDSRFSTPYSMTLSTLQAYERLREFLQIAIATEGSPILQAAEKKKRNVAWTDSKAALIELLYAIHSRGSVNFGNISVKQLVTDAEDFFNINLGNVYTSLLTMGIRKKGRTPYLHSLIQSLENRLDEKDE